MANFTHNVYRDVNNIYLSTSELLYCGIKRSQVRFPQSRFER